MSTAHDAWTTGASAPLALADLLINLGIAGTLAFGLGLHYRTFGSTLASRESFGKVFPFIALTTALLISIVKSSLALSLGLVGALSIVRFRTPVKEPEELAYIFLAITIGLGLGADFRIATTAATALILCLVTLVQLRSRRVATRNLYINLGERNDLWGMICHECAQIPLTFVKARHLVDTLHQGELVVRLAEEDRRALLRPLQRWLRRLAWTGLLVALAFYLREANVPAAGWLSLCCFGGAALRLLWWRETF